MNTIWKYEIPITDKFELFAPRGARALSVQIQFGDEPYLWMLVDKNAPGEERRFRLVGTGHPIENAASLSFIGTFQLHGGALVFHLFEEVSL